MESLIAKALATDLNTSVQLSMKAVSPLIYLNAGIYSLYKLQRQVRGIAVRIISLQSNYYDLTFVPGDRPVELYQVPELEHPDACQNHE